MRYRQIDLNLFVVFDTLLRTGSASKAALSLGISQSAVSQALAKLRKHFGDDLFLKTSTGVTPTSVALSLAEDVRQFVDFSKGALTNRAGFDPLTSRRDIRISTSDMGEIRIVPLMIERFRRLAPNCRLIFLDLWGDELREGFERGEIDLVINARTPPVGDVLQQRLYEGSQVIMTHRSNPIDASISAAELAAAAHLVVSPGRLAHVGVGDAPPSLGTQRHVAAQISNWLSVPHILEAQPDLVALVPQNLAKTYARFNLKVIRPKFALRKIVIFQFWHRRVNTDPFNLWLRAQVRDMLAPQSQDRSRRSR